MLWRVEFRKMSDFDNKFNKDSKFGERFPPLKCSFCGKDETQVSRLIAGPGVFICNECVRLCDEILEDEVFFPSKTDQDDHKEKVLLSPAEIKTELDKYVIGQDLAKRLLQFRFIIITKEFSVLWTSIRMMMLNYPRAIS